MTSELLPCPRCKSTDVEWTNCRDREILISCIRCSGCELDTFEVHTLALQLLPNLDYKTTVMKYNAWVLTNPTHYQDEVWGDTGGEMSK